MSHKNRAYVALCAAEFFNSLVFFAPVALLVRTRCGITSGEFFVLQAILSLCIFAFEIPCGFLTDRIGFKNSLVISQILLCAVWFLFWLGGNFVLFAVAAVLQAFSICLQSGTMDSYVYKIFGSGEFVSKTSVIENFATAGFILSTLIFVPLNNSFGIGSLIFATLLASGGGMIFLALLPKEDCSSVLGEEKRISVKKFFSEVLLKMLSKKMISIFVLSSILSLGVFITNFFFIIKITESGLSKNLMGFVIIAYSAVQLSAPLILRRLSGANVRLALFLEFSFIAIMLFVLSFARGFFVLFPMLVLPLLMRLPAVLLLREQNLLVDEMGISDERATVLSVLNQGKNATDVVFLFAASALPSSNVNLLFLLTGVVFFMNAILALKVVRYSAL
ncbi:MFS transporter [Treponema zioleckii]|uniref:MFS transporter n=1 Tax=Treponema zioleckii TaxID=331680 RepID=UPI00168A67C9|nr:MFS transporter [Treponema zioleckii]